MTTAPRPDLTRYTRQTILPAIGAEGQHDGGRCRRSFPARRAARAEGVNQAKLEGGTSPFTPIESK